MTLSERDRRALAGLGIALAGVLVFVFWGGEPAAAPVAAGAESIPIAEKRLDRLRQVAATVPGKEAALRQVQADLAAREKGLINADTAPQAQAQLLQVARRVARAEGIDVRGGEIGSVRPLGADYGEVSVAVTFDCRIEQLVNFLAAITREPELLATSELRVTAGNPKEKIVQVRLGISGVVPRRLVPEKRAGALF